MRRRDPAVAQRARVGSAAVRDLHWLVRENTSLCWPSANFHAFTAALKGIGRADGTSDDSFGPPEDCHWSAPVGLSTAGQRLNRGSFRGQGPEVAAPENDELRNRLNAAEGIEGRR